MAKLNNIEKENKPHTLSWILKSSILEAAINDIDCNAEFSVKYWVDGPLFECFYWSRTNKFPDGRFYIRTGVCEGDERRAQQIALVSDVIPSFIEWAIALIQLPINSTELLMKPYFSACFEDGVGKVNRGYAL